MRISCGRSMGVSPSRTPWKLALGILGFKVLPDESYEQSEAGSWVCDQPRSWLRNVVRAPEQSSRRRDWSVVGPFERTDSNPAAKKIFLLVKMSGSWVAVLGRFKVSVIHPFIFAVGLYCAFVCSKVAMNLLPDFFIQVPANTSI